ncbi:MAG TPA: NAD-dependent epimerase/dehydratase family protein [Acidimicrobiales bacterium]|jgi:2'-hydroxyisoflavone reductase|nr:NAD-dependent epimerase/dehydratase family protein [Acidimicrobiales bacterium]
MKILIVGGTSFVGRAIAWSAWHNGHEIAVLNRGVTANDLPESIERLVGDRRGDLSALEGRHFDATVDAIAYRPSDVERLALALDGRGGHYVQISSVSAYEEPAAPGGTEATLTLSKDPKDLEAPITETSYGPLKAASERAGIALFGDDSTMVRPTYVIGSHDATLRFPYWVERARRGGVIAVPGPEESVIQYVDARDLANFVVRVAEEGLPGAYHVAGPTPPGTFVQMVDAIARQVAPAETSISVVSPDDVRAEGLADKFPLWSPVVENVSAVDSSLALSQALQLRPLDDSVDDVIEWWGDRAWPKRWLTSDEESRLFHR